MKKLLPILTAICLLPALSFAEGFMPKDNSINAQTGYSPFSGAEFYFEGAVQLNGTFPSSLLSIFLWAIPIA